MPASGPYVVCGRHHMRTTGACGRPTEIFSSHVRWKFILISPDNLPAPKSPQKP